MPLYKNVSEVLVGTESKDLRFTEIILPDQFNLWFQARNKLVEANPGHELEALDPAQHMLGMLTDATTGEGKGFMVILPKSKYYTTLGC